MSAFRAKRKNQYMWHVLPMGETSEINPHTWQTVMKIPKGVTPVVLPENSADKNTMINTAEYPTLSTSPLSTIVSPEQLLPCPFCGGDIKLEEKEIGDCSTEEYWEIECENCDISMVNDIIKKTKGESDYDCQREMSRLRLIMRWNRRV